MSCRCGEIENIQSIIAKLTSAVDKLDSYDSNLSGMTMQAGTMTLNVGWAITSNFAAPVNEKVQKLPDGFSSVGNCVRTKIASRVSELQKELEPLREEDRWHHEAEERERRRRGMNGNVPARL